MIRRLNRPLVGLAMMLALIPMLLAPARRQRLGGRRLVERLIGGRGEHTGQPASRHSRDDEGAADRGPFVRAQRHGA
jgi:hypothetical protein